MTIDFYYVFVSPPCRSVMLLAKNLGIEMNMKEMNFLEKDHLKPDFIKINPQHTIPTLVDNGFAVWESRAILGYLVNKYGKDDSLYPKDPKKRALVDQRLYFDIGTLYAKQTEYYRESQKEGGATKEALKKFEEPLEFLDTFLEGQDWVAGNSITIADYTIANNVALFELFGQDLDKYKNVSKWFSRARKTIKGFDEMHEDSKIAFKKFVAAQKQK